MAKMELEGVEELLSELQKLGDQSKRVENKALREAGSVVEDAIKNEAPVRSGTLKKSIKTSGVKTKDGMKHVEVGPGNDGFYGKFIEFGTVHIKANPFMGRGYEKSKNEAMNKISEEIRKGLGL
ncbi:HK97 gp10 family phage protein [Alkalicella caledoniensis]|uniref:HK97 gp10 family phage protein n=2 Tax=Alkalicella caledoniensis TaxID=2731377 RepID=A0A7G9W3S0_ALKCA|nr:HK97 gp10 family phage protein [Alkalicella caledoniensis]